MAVLKYLRGVDFFADRPVVVDDIELSAPETTVGRSSKAEVSVPSHMLAQCHARFVWKDEAWWVEDLKTPNGTYVNGVRIQTLVPLQDGDEIHLPGFLFVFRENKP